MSAFSPTTSGDGGLPARAVLASLLVALLAVGCQAADRSPEPSDAEVDPDAEVESADVEDASEASRSDVADPAADERETEPGASEAQDAPRDGPAAPDAPLEDGRHPAFLHKVDVAGRTVTVDVIQFLTGQAATDAYHAEAPDDPDGPPNDYYILNVNPLLRTLPVSVDVTVELVRLHEDGDADLDAGTWSELPDYLALDAPGDARLSWNPYWLTVQSGEVIALEEQYLP